MIKYYCDICGKEIDFIDRVLIDYGSYACKTCANKLYDDINKTIEEYLHGKNNKDRSNG